MRRANSAPGGVRGAAASIITMLALTCAVCARAAETIPDAARQHHRTLARHTLAEFGRDFSARAAAQIHQESGWKPSAVSPVGAKGPAQFMPATARWAAQSFAADLGSARPEDYGWAIPAMIRYDALLHRQVGQARPYLDDDDRWWAALRAYNGGIGHWLQEADKAGAAATRLEIDAACGDAKRARSHCPENLGYPRRIIEVLELRYRAVWGVN